jgi:hypothetical protein
LSPDGPVLLSSDDWDGPGISPFEGGILNISPSLIYDLLGTYANLSK